MSPPPLRKSTRLMRAGAPPFSDGSAPVNVPVERTSTVRFESTSSHAALHKRREAGEAVGTYGRHGTQTHRALEAAIGELEGARDVLLAPSGLSAISLVFIGLLSPGDHVLVHDGVYGPVRERIEPLLTRLGVIFSYFSAAEGLPHKQLQANTRLIYA
jgi:cystathionine beta-lyase